MSRDVSVYLDDILVACGKIIEYTRGYDRATFVQDSKTFDAVVRNLEVIGEAVKQIPDDWRAAHPVVDWRRIAGFRDILIHAYFGVDEDVVWDVVENKVPELVERVGALLEE